MAEQLVNEAFGNILPYSHFALTKGVLLTALYLSIKPPLMMDPPNAKVINAEYDFIVVGAGSAGSVIASRLSQNKDFQILLLEAGGDENGISETPLLAPTLQLTELDWQYKVEPSPGACLGMINKTCFYPRGKVLGGSSTINYLNYLRGNKKDFNNWSEAGNYGWSYEEVLPYFKKSEDNRNPLYAQNERYHSTKGELTVSDASYTTPLADAFIQAGREIGYSIGDYNAENQTVFSMGQHTIRDGTRCSASKGFLHPVSNFKNLNIGKFAHVTKIIIDPVTRRANGVRFFRYGSYHQVYARKEVILSAGAINTPQLLMLSGIGPKDHLKELNIELIKDLPVGHNLQDHVGFPMIFLTDKPITIIPEREINLPANMTYDVHKRGGKIVQKLEETQPFKEINAKYHLAPIPICPSAKALSDQYFECLMRYYTISIFHPCGTAKMGPDSDPSAVVDPELRVRGISGLRVADASIMPTIITGLLNSNTIMIGEKAADLIKSSWTK